MLIETKGCKFQNKKSTKKRSCFEYELKCHVLLIFIQIECILFQCCKGLRTTDEVRRLTLSLQAVKARRPWKVCDH